MRTFLIVVFLIILMVMVIDMYKMRKNKKNRKSEFDKLINEIIQEGNHKIDHK